MTDKAKMYAVKNYCGEYLVDPSLEIGDWDEDINLAYLYKHKEYAEEGANRHGGHVVELVEKPEPEVVSEEEAEMLATLRDGDLMPASELSYFVHYAEQLLEKESIEREDRLMRAYVNGWTVEKPKRYVLPMPDGVVGDRNRAMRIAIRDKDEGWYGSTYRYDVTASETPSYTKADLNNAPGWVKAITPVEATDDEQ